MMNCSLVEKVEFWVSEFDFEMSAEEEKVIP